MTSDGAATQVMKSRCTKCTIFLQVQQCMRATEQSNVCYYKDNVRIQRPRYYNRDVFLSFA